MKLLLLSFCVLFSVVSSIVAQDLTVERIWKNYEFWARGVSGFRSMKDGEFYTAIDAQGNIRKYAITKENDEGSILVAKKDLAFNGKALNFEEYEFNSSETKMLLMTKVEYVFRRSFEAEYYLYDLETKKVEQLDASHSPQRLAEYSPNGEMVSFIHGNDLFVKYLKSGKISKLTKDGKKNKIINGTTDWVYEEEFAITKAYGWSPDSKNIAYLKFDETNVPKYQMKYYGSLYPEYFKFKYPKAGEQNSVVTAHMLCVKNGKSRTIALGKYEYIPRLKWAKSSNKLVLQTLNRHQNHLSYYLVQESKNKLSVQLFYEEESDTYIDIDDNLSILSTSDHLLRTSEKSGFNHIYKLGFDGKETQITKGNWDVIEFLGTNAQENLLYFSSAQTGAINKVISKIDVNGENEKMLTQADGYSNADFTNGMKYFVHSYSNAGTPTTYTLRNENGDALKTIESNESLKETLASLRLSPKEFLKVNAAGVELNAWLIKPLDFDSTKRYPVYVNVYGGPGSNKVTNSWGGNDFMFHQLLAQHGYVVFCVDPRGTMYRGANFKKSTYTQLGKLEIEDVLNACKELQKLSYIDKNRFGIMGWSYGGYMAALGITKGADIFKMAISVAPVTNWRYYDNIYTERFMKLPQENADGYDDNSPINHVDKLQGKFLLIHGGADDNVHLQNSMEMVDALVKANKQFDLFIYPNKNHGIYGGNTRNHLFNMMFRYIKDNL